MTDYKKMVAEHACNPPGCEPMSLCMCALADNMANEIERLREDNDTLQRMLKLAATWKVDPGVTIAEMREVFSLLDRAALGEKE